MKNEIIGVDGFRPDPLRQAADEDHAAYLKDHEATLADHPEGCSCSSCEDAYEGD